nr:hypothetical protein Itr_chr14CG12070 [Ipomoea trifida]
MVDDGERGGRSMMKGKTEVLVSSMAAANDSFASFKRIVSEAISVSPPLITPS